MLYEVITIAAGEVHQGDSLEHPYHEAAPVWHQLEKNSTRRHADASVDHKLPGSVQTVEITVSDCCVAALGVVNIILGVESGGRSQVQPVRWDLQP